MGLVKHIFMPELLPEHRSRYILITKAESIPEQIKIVGVLITRERDRIIWK